MVEMAGLLPLLALSLCLIYFILFYLFIFVLGRLYLSLMPTLQAHVLF